MINPSNNDLSYLEYLIKKRGQPTSQIPVDNAIIEKWQGILPNRLLYFWQELGWCNFKDGLLWLVNPDDYQHLVDDWIKGSAIEELDTYHCYARTAFGELYLFAKNSKRFLKIMPQHQTIWVDIKKLKRPQKDGEDMLGIILCGFDKKFDLMGYHGKGLYDEAKNKLGKLKANEMYTFVPFLMMLPDEKFTVDNLQKVQLDIQLDILRQLDEPTLRGTSYSDIYK